MVREQQVLDLIGRIYDAALEASHWPAVLQDLVRLTYSNTGNLAELDLTSGATTPIAAVDLPRKGCSDYEAYHSQADAADDEHHPHAVGTGALENRHQPSGPPRSAGATGGGSEPFPRSARRSFRQTVLAPFASPKWGLSRDNPHGTVQRENRAWVRTNRSPAFCEVAGEHHDPKLLPYFS